MVPYKGAAPAVTDLLGGQIKLFFADLPVIIPHFRSGALHPVGPGEPATQRDDARTADHRRTRLSRMPADNWYSLLGPARLPAPMLDRLSAVLKTASPGARGA